MTNEEWIYTIGLLLFVIVFFGAIYKINSITPSFEDVLLNWKVMSLRREEEAKKRIKELDENRTK